MSTLSRDHGSNYAAQAERVARLAADREALTASAVNREPCWHCGTRRDVGCRHTRWER